MTTNILRIDASARNQGSVSRVLTDRILARFSEATVTRRDLTDGVPLLSEDWVNGTFTPADARSKSQIAALAQSDVFVSEVQNADVIVIGAPVYNFNIPAGLKAWIDQISRVGVTFEYGADGPQGLLKDKRVIVTLASGGTQVGADNDFATPYLRYVLGFLGLTDIEFVDASGLAIDSDAAISAANEAVDALKIAA